MEKLRNNLVSIIVPNFIHSQFLKSRLDSILNQTYDNFEVIILDDSSTDKSQNILSQHANHPKVSHCIFNEENSGSTFKQWDKGIGLARGEYVWIAESDDYCEETFLEELIKLHLGDSGLALSFCQSHRMDVHGKVTGNWFTHTSEYEDNVFGNDFIMDGNEFIEKYLIHKNVIPNVSAVLFKKEELEKITPLVFKPFMKYNADWFYYVQLLCNSKVAFVAKTLNYFRYHQGSVIANADVETNKLDILKMEMRVRKEMLKYMKNCKPQYFNRLVEEYRKGNNRLKFLIAKEAIDQNKIIEGLILGLSSKPLGEKIFRYFLKS